MFSENYSVCLNDDGSPREIGRNGPVVTYKAIGYDSGRTVAMQLIPLASLSEGERVRFEESAQAARNFDHDNITKIFDVGAEDDHMVFVSEYVEGESAEDWIDEHGPMPADAVLRIGFQVVNALAAAEERGLPSRAIQPANLIIPPGVAADGGWPGIKVRNSGLPAVKLNSEGGETRELVPSVPPQFASPEQRENTALDVRSDIFSLGATMWFLLTGSAPPVAGPNESGPRLSAPDVPRFVRNLVSHMLRTDPEKRPRDLAAFAERIRACLQKAERRTAFTRSFAPAAIPGTQKVEKKRIAPALAMAAAIVLLAALGAFFLPQQFANRERKPLGVVIGVPETTPEASPISESSAAPVAAPQQGEQSQVIAEQSVLPATPAADSRGEASRFDELKALSQSKGSASPEVAKNSALTQLADNNRMAEQPAPAEGPAQTNQPLVAAEVPPPAEKSEPPQNDIPDSAGTTDSSSMVTEKAKSAQAPASSENIRKRDDSRSSKRKSRRQRLAKYSVRRPVAPLRVGSESARLVGTTPRGNWVLRTPSGETVIAPPVPDLEDAPIVSPRHIRRVERPIPTQDEPPIVVLPPNY